MKDKKMKDKKMSDHVSKVLLLIALVLTLIIIVLLNGDKLVKLSAGFKIGDDNGFDITIVVEPNNNEIEK